MDEIVNAPGEPLEATIPMPMNPLSDAHPFNALRIAVCVFTLLLGVALGIYVWRTKWDFRSRVCVIAAIL